MLRTFILLFVSLFGLAQVCLASKTSCARLLKRSRNDNTPEIVARHQVLRRQEAALIQKMPSLLNAVSLNDRHIDIAKAFELAAAQLRKTPSKNSPEEAAELESTVRAIYEHRSKIVQDNKKFALSIANRYHRPAAGIPKDDIEQAAFLGLLRAADDFKPESGNAFTTYAKFWIRRYIQDAQQGQIFIQHSMLNIARKLLSLKNTEPSLTDQDIQERLNISEETLQSARLAMNAFKLSSMDAPLKTTSKREGKELTRHDTISSNSHEALLESLQVGQRIVLLKQALSQLPERERFVVESFYGLGDKEELTPAEIGASLGKSSHSVMRYLKHGMQMLLAVLSNNPRFSDLR